MKKQFHLVVLFFLCISSVNSQVFFNSGAAINAKPGAFIKVNGSVQNQSGTITIEESSGVAAEITIQSDFINNSTAGGGGNYKISGNWINNNTFNALNGNVFLEGSNQNISGSVTTDFNNLILTGSGIKTQTIHQNVNGVLNLNDRELQTQTFGMFVKNTNTNSIQRTTGFVSSLNGGFLSRNTNSTGVFLFPVGSTIGTTRYRPVEITPTVANANTYTVRLANLDATSEGFDRNQKPASVCNLNPNFYHQINRTQGSSSAEIAVYFDSASDGNWGGIARWTTGPTQWLPVTPDNVTAGIPYSKATISNWNNFSQIPYILYNSNIQPVFNQLGPFCQWSPLQNLPTTSLNGITGMWDPSNTINTQNAGTVTYTFTPAINFCSLQATMDVTVIQTPVIQLVNTVCSPDLTTYTVNFTSTIGTISTTAGLVSGNSVINIPSGTNVTITSTNTGCTASLPVTAPDCSCPAVPAPSAPNNPSVCQGQANPALTVSVNSGYTVNWYNLQNGGLLLASGNSYLPSESAPGTYTYYAEAVDNISGCKSSRIQVTLTIIQTPVVSSPANVSVCDQYILPAIPNGSYFSSPNGIGSLAVGSVISGSQTIYVFAQTGTVPNCTNESSFVVTVNSSPVLQLVSTTCSPDLQTYSVQFSNSAGNVTTTAGTVSGNSILSIPSGTNIVITSNNNGCQTNLSVNAPVCSCPVIPTPQNPNNPSICQGQNIPALSVSVGSNYVVNWYMIQNGGMPIANGTTYVPQVSLPGTYTYYAEAQSTINNCLSLRIPVTLTIIATPAVDTYSNVSACDNYILPAIGNGGYYGSPNGVNPLWAGFNITSNQTVYIFAQSGTTPNCTNESSFQVVINQTPFLSFVSSACSPDLSTYSVNFTSTVGQITSNAGIINGNTINSVPAGTNLIITANNSGCISTLNVNAPDCSCPFIPAPSSPNNPSVCEGQPTPSLTVTTGAGYTINWYTLPSAGSLLGSGFSFTPNVTLSGTYTYYAEAVDTQNGCKSNRTPVTLTIIGIPQVDSPANITVCNNYILPALTHGAYFTSPNGANPISAGTNLTSTQTIYVYAQSGTSPNCTNQNSFVVNINYSPVLTLLSTTCSPDLTTYDVQIGTTGGTISSTAGTVNGLLITAIPAGTNIIVTGNNNSCISTLPITAPNCSCPFIPAPVSTGNQSICQGQAIPSLTVTVNSGYSVNWYTTQTGGLVISSGTSYTPQNSIPGTYTYYAEATETANGCVSLRTPLLLTIIGTPPVDIVSDVSVCNNYILPVLTNGGYFSSSGGTGSLPVGSNLTSNQTIYIFAQTGTSPNCTNESSFAVIIHQTPVLNLISTTCSPDLTTYDVVFSVSTGIVTSSSGTVTGNTISDIPAGTNIIITANNSGCISTLSVNAPNCNCPQIPVPTNPNNPKICNGQATPLLSVTSAGSYTINWYEQAVGGSSIGSGVNYLPLDNTPGTYTYYAESYDEQNGCSSSRIPVTLTIIAIPPVDILSDVNVCDSYILPVISNGSYFTSSGGVNPITAGTALINNQTIFIYAESGTQPNCFNENSFSVTIHISPTIELGSNVDLCSGETYTIDAGAGFQTYDWSNSLSTQTITVSSSNTYSVTITDMNNCSANDDITVTFHQQFDATITTNQLQFCENSNSLNFSAQDAGGLWTGNGITAQGLFNPSLAGAGQHQIVYTIAGNCGDADTVNVNVFGVPVVSLGNDTSFCQGSQITLDAGNGFESYNWTPSGNTQTIVITQSDTYSVTVTDTHQCSGSAQIVISVLPQSDATITTTGPYCSNNLPIQFNSVEEGGIWSGNGISLSGIFNPTTAGEGNHQIIYTISSACPDADTVQITVFPTPMVTTLVKDESCILADDGEIHVTVTGGTPGYSIVWGNGMNGYDLNGLKPGAYMFIVSDNNLCTVTTIDTVHTATVDCNYHVYIPNIFSPNNDGENDMLFVRGLGIESLELSIYNRWGERIFYSTDITDGWDGKYLNKDVEVGVYAYIAKGTFKNFTTFEKFGTITIVR